MMIIFSKTSTFVSLIIFLFSNKLKDRNIFTYGPAGSRYIWIQDLQSGSVHRVRTVLKTESDPGSVLLLFNKNQSQCFSSCWDRMSPLSCFLSWFPVFLIPKAANCKKWREKKVTTPPHPSLSSWTLVITARPNPFLSVQLKTRLNSKQQISPKVMSLQQWFTVSVRSCGFLFPVLFPVSILSSCPVSSLYFLYGLIISPSSCTLSSCQVLILYSHFSHVSIVSLVQSS